MRIACTGLVLHFRWPFLKMLFFRKKKDQNALIGFKNFERLYILRKIFSEPIFVYLKREEREARRYRKELKEITPHSYEIVEILSGIKNELFSCSSSFLWILSCQFYSQILGSQKDVLLSSNSASSPATFLSDVPPVPWALPSVPGQPPLQSANSKMPLCHLPNNASRSAHRKASRSIFIWVRKGWRQL